MLVDENADDEDVDDPIQLHVDDKIDIRWYSDEVVVIDDDSDDTEANKNNSKISLCQVQFDEYIHNFPKIISTLPQSFSYIEKNIEQLNKCRPLKIQIVDCNKFPWYYKNTVNISQKEDEKEDDIVIIDNISDIKADYNVISFYDENCNVVNKLFENNPVKEKHSHDHDQRKRSLSYSNGKKELIDFTKYNKQKVDTEAKTNLNLVDNETLDLYLNIGSLIEKAFREIKQPENGLLKSSKNDHLNNKKNIYSDSNILEINSHKIISNDRKDIVNNQNLKLLTKGYCNEDNIINNKNIIEQSEHNLKGSYLEENKESTSKASDVNIIVKKGIKCLKRNTAITNDSESLKNKNICQNYKSYQQCTKQLHNANKVIPHFHSSSSIDTKATSKSKCRHKIAPTVSVNHQETNNNQDNTNETGQIVNRLKNVTNYQLLFNGFCGQDNNLHESLDKSKKCTINSETVLDNNFVLKNPFSTFMNSSLPQVCDYPISQLFTENVVNTSMTQNTLMNTRDSISSEPNSECDNLVAPFVANQESCGPNNLSKNNFASSSSNSDIVTAVNYKSNRNLQVNSFGCNKVPHTQINSKNKHPIIKHILNSPAAYSSDSKNSPVPNSQNLTLNTRNNLGICLTQTVQDTYRAPSTPLMQRFPFCLDNIRQPLRSINSKDIQKSIPKRPLYYAQYGGQPGFQPGGMPTYNYRPTNINAYGKYSSLYKPYSMPSATNEIYTSSAYTHTSTNKSVPGGSTSLVYPASLSGHSSKDNQFDNVAENTYQNINYSPNLQFMKEVSNSNATTPLSTNRELIRRYELPNTCVVTCKESPVNATAPLLNNQPCLVSSNQNTTNQVSQSLTCSVTSTMCGQSDEVQLNMSQVTVETLTLPTPNKHNVTSPSQVIDNMALTCSQLRQSSVSIATAIPSQGLRFINPTSAPYSPSCNHLQKVLPPKMAVATCCPKTMTAVSISQNVNRLKVNKPKVCLSASASQTDDSVTSALVPLNGDHAQSLKTVTLKTRVEVPQEHRSSNLTRDPRISKYYGLQESHAFNIPVISCGQVALKANINSNEALRLSSPPTKIAECLKPASVYGRTQNNSIVNVNDPTFLKISQPKALKNSTPNEHKPTHLQSQLHSYNAPTFTSTNESLQNTFLFKQGESQKQCMSNLNALTKVSNDTSLNAQVLCNHFLPNESTDVAKSPTSVPTSRQLKKVSMCTFIKDPKATNDLFSDRNKLTFDDMTSSSQIVKDSAKTVTLVANCETPTKTIKLNSALSTFPDPSKYSTASKIQKPTQSLPLAVACQLPSETKRIALAHPSGKTQKCSVSLDLKTNNESKFTMPILQVSKDLAGQCTSESSETQKSTSISSSDSIGFYSPPILPISSYEKTLEVFEQLNSSYLDYDRLSIIRQDNCSKGNKVKRKSFDTCEKSAKRISLQKYKKRP